MSDSIMSPDGLLQTYGPTLFVPARNKFDPTKKPRYEASVIVDKAGQQTPEYKALGAALKAALVAEFGEAKMKDPTFTKRLKLPIKDYDKGENGEKVIKAWTYNAPEIVDGRLQDITVQSDVWSGQRARLMLAPWAFNTNGSVGVMCFLNGVQITKKDMPRLPGSSGAMSAKKAFSVVEDEETGSALGGAADEDADDLPF